MESIQLYLDLMKKTLVDYYQGDELVIIPANEIERPADPQLIHELQKFLNRQNLQLARSVPFDPAKRSVGLDWPSQAESMIGLKRLENIQECAEYILNHKIDGDFIETGAWRGGACIFMRAILKAYGITDRKVFVADSFEGLPPPNPEKYPADEGDLHSTVSFLAVSLEQVKANFQKYGLLDEQVQFLKGWFKDTLPVAPVDKIALLRLDGDIYESTMDALNALYPKLSPGGFCIIDDYGAIKACKEAVHDYRKAHNISEEIKEIDWTGVYWQKLV